jgi:subtilase family serine protease
MMKVVPVGFIATSRSTNQRSILARIAGASAIGVTLLASALPAWAAGSVRAPLPAPFHTIYGAHGATSTNVCSYATAPGTAHCNATRRTDSAALRAYPRPANHKSPIASPAVVGNGGAYDPSYLQSAYNVASLAAAHGGGVGQIVAVVDAYDDPNLASDLAAYRSHFGLSACVNGTVSPSATGCVFQKVNEFGQSAPLPATNASWGVESSLDVEMVSAICPKCEILIVEANQSALSDLGTSVNTAVSLGAVAVSNSYGSGEYSSEVQDSFNYYNHPGVDITVSSGDSGYGVDFPAASPFVTAVGGTSLNQSSNTGTRNASETVWSGAGAGCSAFEPKPSWQHDTGCSRRTVADVAAVADPATGVWVYDTFGHTGYAIYGGTSASSPIIAALYALAGNSRSSSVLPASYLYQSPNALVPITSGNDGTCASYLCNANLSQNGYNGPTGLGSPGASPNSLNAFTSFTGTPTAPSAPTLVSATGANSSVNLTWSAPSNNGGSAVSGYNVFAGSSSGAESSTPLNSAPLSSLNYSVTGLINGSTYFFTVRALNAVGTSPASNELSATPQNSPIPPSSPSLTSATSSNGAVSLSWNAPSSNGSSPLTGYNVYVGSSPGAESATATNSSLVTSTSFTVNALTNGSTYYFVIQAVSAAGSSASSNELSARPGALPGTITSLFAHSDHKFGVDLSWSASVGVTSYILYRSSTSGAESSLVTVGCTNSTCSFVDSSTSRSVTYYYQIAGVNSVGTGARSAQVFAVAK